MKYYVIEKGNIKEYSLFGSFTKKIKNVPAIIALTDRMAKYYFEENSSKEFNTDGIVYSDNSYCFGSNTRISSFTLRLATPKEVKHFTKVAASINLCYKLLVCHHTNIWNKKEWDETYEGLGYIDKDKVRFKLNGELVSFEELKAYEPNDGLNFAFYHDNGYSYLCVDPTSKENYLKAVSKIGESKVRYGNLNGIDYLENGVINVRFCAERYSEISNT